MRDLISIREISLLMVVENIMTEKKMMMSIISRWKKNIKWYKQVTLL